jgi:hypothetical protein
VRGDAEGVRQASHALAGSDACVGAVLAAACCSEVEAAARDGRVPDAAQVRALRWEHDRAAAALRPLTVSDGRSAHAHPGR